MFQDRKDAGMKLAAALVTYRDSAPLILAIPRGGVAVADPVARALGAELSLLVSRKLPLPDNPEAGFGAIAEDGSTFLREGVRGWLQDERIQIIIEKQKQIVQDRIRILREGKPLPSLRDRTLILIDDGLANGSTMRAALVMCRKREPETIVVAVPVASRNTKDLFQKLADDLVVLETPVFFRAVAQVYEEWHDLSDKEVLMILHHTPAVPQARERKSSPESDPSRG
ncbi:MAG TPA: phosphoribosyltransferase [Spirochaetia bacterium]|nr:phosphoribosyltransferase [Spirochaetia bacterium]